MKISNEIIIEKARSLGFDLIGFAKADELTNEVEHLEKWLARNYQAGMNYMERNLHKRKNVKEILPGAKSVISLAMNYYTPHNHTNEPDKGNISVPAGKPCRQAGRVSRYAWRKDYHLIIWEKLFTLESELKKIDPEFDSISYVDTGPVMDKVWAVRSGIGWMGKHTNVINQDFGSWIFLATIITNCEFEYSEVVNDLCGTCTACIDACPTDAIVQDYVVDSNKCISYLTIENKNDIPNEFKGKFENWIFGCDICQDVCPWNIKFSQITSEPNFNPKQGKVELSKEEIQEMDEESFLELFEQSPIKRAKLKGLKRNAGFLWE